METSSLSLRDRCHVNTNSEIDRFVGIKVDSENVKVHFPIGYHLPTSDNEIRKHIIHLVQVLSEFSVLQHENIHAQKNQTLKSVLFPVNSYLEIMSNYIEQRSYYTEKIPTYKTSNRGLVDWGKTFRNQKLLLQSDNSPIYLNQTVRESRLNERNLITQIHKYCVYQSFLKLGWLFTDYLPPKPDFPIDKKRFIIELNNKLNKTYNDKDKKLFISMISLLTYIDKETTEKVLYYGTSNFEYIWEKLINRIFGIKNKDAFFPKATWKIRGRREKNFEALRPDTIMIFDNKYFVLDAKYYKFGLTGETLHLPEGKSIHKQITYGEFIFSNKKFSDINGNRPIVYNAFLLPYNSKENIFGFNNLFENFGEGTGEWKGQNHTYSKVQGIFVDINYIIHNYIGDHSKKIKELAETIEDYFNKNE